MPSPAMPPGNADDEFGSPFYTEEWQDFQARLFRELDVLVAGQRRLEHRLCQPAVAAAPVNKRLSGVVSHGSDAAPRRSSFRMAPGEVFAVAHPHAGSDAAPGRTSFRVVPGELLGRSQPARDAAGFLEMCGAPSVRSMRSGRGAVDRGRMSPKASEGSLRRGGGELLSAGLTEDSFCAPTLPLDWPKALKIRPGLGRDNNNGQAMATSSVFRQVRSEFRSASGLWEKNERTWGIMEPNTRAHSLYACISMLVLLHDLIVGPWELAWTVPMVGYVGLARLVTSVFWTIDMGVKFTTAFARHSGELEYRRRKIAVHYLKTWFAMDFIVVFASWLGFAWDEYIGESNGEDASSTVTMLRFTQCLVNAFRVFRLVKVFDELAQRNLSEGVRLILHIAYFCANIMWVAHILACVWFALTHIDGSDTGAKWTDFAGVSVGTYLRPFESMPYFYQYTSALHWASGQITMGGSDLSPKNSVERVMQILSLMVGFLIASMVVSSLSATMVDYQLMRKERTETTRTLRQYLSQNRVDPVLRVRVQRQVEDRLSQKKRISEQDVKALALLSKALQSELRFQVQRPHLAKHPLLGLFMRMDSSAVASISTDAVEFVDLRANDELFLPGYVTDTAWYLMDGHMTYTQFPNYAPVEQEETSTIFPGQWLCEAALWSEWTCVGQVEANVECSVLSFNAAEMASCLSGNQSFLLVLREYARQFHKRIINARPPAAPWPSDLEVPFTDYCDLVSSMNTEVQSVIGMDAIDVLKQTKPITAQAMHNLTTEVENGKSILVVTGEGCVYRLASIVALRVEGDDGRFLTQIAKLEDNSVKPSCQLPGVKQDRNELVEDTLLRFLRKKMPFLNDKVELVETFRQNVEKRSKEFGIQTKYLRTVCVMRFKPGDALDMLRCQVDATNPCMDEFLTQADDPSGRFWRQALRREVHAVIDKGATTFYTWMNEPELEFFSSPAGEPLLRAWASVISVCDSGSDTLELDEANILDDDLVGPRLV